MNDCENDSSTDRLTQSADKKDMEVFPFQCVAIHYRFTAFLSVHLHAEITIDRINSNPIHPATITHTSSINLEQFKKQTNMYGQARRNKA